MQHTWLLARLRSPSRGRSDAIPHPAARLTTNGGMVTVEAIGGDGSLVNEGDLWLSNEWNPPATDGSSTVSRTWNWSAKA